VQATVQSAVAKFGSLDVVVNNAGVMVFKPIEEHTEEDFMRVIRVDLLGAFFFIKEAFRAMRSGGAIVNVSSVHAEETTPNVVAYGAGASVLSRYAFTAPNVTRGVKVASGYSLSP